MTRQECSAQIARIRLLAKKWYSPLRLFEWDITWKYMDGELISDGVLAELAVATTTADWRYRHCTIQWNLKLVAEQADAVLERILIHEVMHIHLNEMRESDDIGHEERVASTLALCFSDLARRMK